MFWENYLRLCNSVGKAPSAVAVEIGLSDAAPTGWKNGAIPRQAALRKIADYFGVPVDTLMNGETNKAPVQKDERIAAMEGRVAMLVDLFSRLPPSDQDDVIYQLLAKAHNQLMRERLKESE